MEKRVDDGRTFCKNHLRHKYDTKHLVAFFATLKGKILLDVDIVSLDIASHNLINVIGVLVRRKIVLLLAKVNKNPEDLSSLA